MSIICYDDNGWVIDHQSLVNKWYKSCMLTSSGILKDGRITTTGSFQLKIDLFEINSPYMMDSQFEKLQTDKTFSSKKRKRKKRENEDSDGDNLRISNVHKEMVRLAKTKGYFIKHGETILDNNKTARLASQIIGPGDSLLDKVRASLGDEDNSENKSSVNISSSKDAMFKVKNIEVNRCVHYTGDTSVQVQIYNDNYIIPPHSSFLLSDWKQFIHTDITEEKGFDLIVLDPPWMNKSVKRKTSYSTVWEDTLLELPVHKLANDGCLFIIWVTNKPRLHSFIKEEFLPKWKLKYCAQWHWLKVTTSGEMICDINTNMKKPYETLFIAKYNDSNDRPNLPDNEVIISIPCSLHSKKPPLSDILGPYLPSNPKCLELFARNLQAGWTCWGNEVLKHQHIDYFDILPL